MKFCPVIPEICRGQVHVPKKERRRKRIIIIIIKIIMVIQQLFMFRIGYISVHVVVLEKKSCNIFQ
jgi:hypothetical protein